MPDWRFGMWVGRSNFCSLNGRAGEVCEKLRKSIIDMICLQEVRFGGQVVGMMGRRYKLW